MNKRLHVIPLDRLIEIEPPPREPRRISEESAWVRLQTLAEQVKQVKRWHWCLAFALCTSLISGILLLCSINPHGFSLWLLFPGLMYPFQLDAETRKHDAIGTLVIDYSAMGLTELACCVYHCLASHG
jgi:hypothetical protein